MSKFRALDHYQQSSKYALLPFKFIKLDETTDDNRYIAVNYAGEYLLVSKENIYDLVNYNLLPDDPLFIKFKSRHFLYDETSTVSQDLLALKLRTKYSRLSDFTGLHMFVISLRCEHSCPYCQVSRQSEDREAYDMTEEMADKSLDLVFKSPNPNIKIEFQGGEPLLNFEMIKYIVKKALLLNDLENRNLAFVIATNLALLNDEHLEFCSKYDIQISTSLDGPADLHNVNRPRPGGDSYERAVKGIEMARSKLGHYQVSALMTTTERSLSRAKDIIDEYLKLNFAGIFLRPLSPYGFAIKTKNYDKYTTKQWMKFYEEGLDYIIELNKKGIAFKEYYASTILSKIFTSNDPGYVDLMSPSGNGIAAIIYNYNGDVFASDESRMLAEMGIDKFKLGNVLHNSYKEIFLSDNLLDPLEESFALSCPQCTDCAFESYCGSDPVFHYAIDSDYIGHKSFSNFCFKNMEVFRILFRRLHKDDYTYNLLRSWGMPNA